MSKKSKQSTPSLGWLVHGSIPGEDIECFITTEGRKFVWSESNCRFEVIGYVQKTEDKQGESEDKTKTQTQGYMIRRKGTSLFSTGKRDWKTKDVLFSVKGKVWTTRSGVGQHLAQMTGVKGSCPGTYLDCEIVALDLKVHHEKDVNSWYVERAQKKLKEELRRQAALEAAKEAKREVEIQLLKKRAKELGLHLDTSMIEEAKDKIDEVKDGRRKKRREMRINDV